jgi:hypothetical protein
MAVPAIGPAIYRNGRNAASPGCSEAENIFIDSAHPQRQNSPLSFGAGQDANALIVRRAAECFRLGRFRFPMDLSTRVRTLPS